MLERIAAFAAAPAHGVMEIEINPLFVGEQDSCAVDVLMQVQ